MSRRISALLGMLVMVGLALMLIWSIYLHHSQATAVDDATIVSPSGRIL